MNIRNNRFILKIGKKLFMWYYPISDVVCHFFIIKASCLKLCKLSNGVLPSELLINLFLLAFRERSIIIKALHLLPLKVLVVVWAAHLRVCNLLYDCIWHISSSLPDDLLSQLFHRLLRSFHIFESGLFHNWKWSWIGHSFQYVLVNSTLFSVLSNHLLSCLLSDKEFVGVVTCIAFVYRVLQVWTCLTR